MKFPASSTTSGFICVVLLSLCNIAKSDESGHDADATADYYAQYYQDFYNNLAGKDASERDTGYVEPAAAYAEPHYGQAYGVSDVMGELDPALVLGAIGAVMGTLAAIGVVINNNNVNSLSEDQDSICSMTRSIGTTSLATSAITGATTAGAITEILPLQVATNTQLNLIINAINGFATPDCN